LPIANLASDQRRISFCRLSLEYNLVESNRQSAIGSRQSGQAPVANRKSAILIVGLGNPGADYEWSRHNLGFMLINKLAGEAGIECKRRECQALVGRGEVEGVPVKLVKPQTFMNLSGVTVACLVAKHKLQEPGKHLIVISDDLALPFGRIRIRERGSAGGHNGLKSIIAGIGTNEFIRLRLGIQPEHQLADSKRFVLDAFPRTSRTELEQMIERGVAALRCILRDGVLKAMSEYNS
jgi:PTH1 family peptidyl-tRNA hydrolase